MHANEELALYESLRDSAPLLLPERTLFAEINIRLYAAITYDRLRALLLRAKEKGRIITVNTEDGPKHKMGDDGWARLQELNR